MLRIGFDVDNVLNDFTSRCLNILNQRFGTNYTEDIFTEYDVYRSLPHEHADELSRIFVSDIIWHIMLPPSDAQTTISKLVKEGHEVYFISACDTKTHEWKSKWLERIYPFVPVRNHIYTHHKALLSLDVIVDDNPEWIKESMAYRIVLSKPWNAAARESCFDDRASSITEVRDIIERIRTRYED